VQNFIILIFLGQKSCARNEIGRTGIESQSAGRIVGKSQNGEHGGKLMFNH
jgi:hypothetical protein